jgi:tetratricopeptide (TPR) repeat protein
LYIRALSIREQQLRENHPYTANSLNNLAELYRSQGRYTEAEPLYIRALSIREQQLGETHPDTATSLNNLAGLYESQGRYNEAEPLYIRALSILQKTVGNEHPNTQTVMSNYRIMLSQSQPQPSLDKILKEKIIKQKKS